jgi:hypothetical protein
MARFLVHPAVATDVGDLEAEHLANAQAAAATDQPRGARLAHGSGGEQRFP